MTLDWWLILVLASVAISLTPGPNALLALDHGARFGMGRAGFTVTGAVRGTAVKWIGAAYLVWLGVQLWRAPGFAGHARSAARGTISPARAFGTGAAVMLSNPKTILFFTTFLPQFMLPGVPLAAQFAVVAVTLAVVELGVEILLAASAGRLAPWLSRHGRTFNRITGGAFLGIGAMVALTPQG